MNHMGGNSLVRTPSNVAVIVVIILHIAYQSGKYSFVDFYEAIQMCQE